MLLPTKTPEGRLKKKMNGPNRSSLTFSNPVRRAVLISVCLSFGTVWADQIVLKDGDRITGDIIKKDKDTITIKSKNFGDAVSIKWEAIDTIKTDQPLNVVLPGDKTVKAKIETQNGRIQVDTPGTPEAVPPSDIIALRNDAEQRTYERFIHPGLLDLWTVTGSVNIAGSKGNAETSTLITPISFARASNTSRTTAYFNSIRSTATINGVGAQTAKAIRGGWAYNRNLTKRVFLNGFNDYEYDKFQSLDLRVVLGGGLGYLVWNGENGKLGLVGGLAWNHEKFSPVAPIAPFSRDSAEAYWGDDFNYKLNSRTALVQSFRMFNNLSNSGEYRMNFDTGLATAITKWLNWNLALSDRYLSNPVPGRKKNDLLYSTGFGFTFAR
jgi:putative salt-induced outer membrane protein YdiY